MKVLITGGAGFIGSHIVDKLLEKNYNVVIVDNLSSGSLNNLPKNFETNSNIRFYKKDILTDDLTEIFETEKVDYCIHLASQTSVLNSIKKPTFDAELNIIATSKIIELSKKNEIKKLIIASTAAVYGTPQYLPIDETHPTEPISNYGLSKLTMEKYIKLSEIPHVIFRFANVYGPRQNTSQESGVIAIFNDCMLKNKQINIYGDGEQIRDFVYVEDIANICRDAITNENLTNLTLNFSTNNGLTVKELFKIMKKTYNYKSDANYLPERKGEIKNSILSNDKIKRIIPNIETTAIQDGITKLKNYYTDKEIQNA